MLLVYLGTDLIAAWGLNLEFGVAGIPNLAYIVLVAAGAYTYAILTLGPSSANGGFQSYIVGAHLPAAAAILVAMVVAGLLGCLIGLTGLKRLRADYQAIVMLVVSIMASTVVGADTGLFNGTAGLSLIPDPLGAPSGAAITWGYVGFVAAICVAAYAALRRFTCGPIGRLLRAMRDDEDAALALGKNVVALRLVVQGVGGCFAGLSGALLVGFIGGWSPSSWVYIETLALFTAIIVGGVGSDVGVLLGVAIVPVAILQGVQFLPPVQSNPGLMPAISWIVVSLLTIAFLFLRPVGVIPERRPKASSATDSGNTRSPLDAETTRRHLAAMVTIGPTSPARQIDGGSATSDDAWSSVLEVENLSRHFGGVRAVDGTTFSVRRGSITGLIGPNGAGKSTALGVISGFIAPTAGSVRFLGTDVTHEPAYRRARRGLVRTFQLPHEFGGLTTLENLVVAAPRQRGESARAVLAGRRYWRREEAEQRDRAMEMLDVFGMTTSAGKLARHLSGGQKRMVEVMRALMARPTLLLLDEPLAGLSPALCERLETVCLLLKEQGVTVLLVEHELGAVERLCDHVITMVQGSVLAEGTMAGLRANKDVQAAYIGG